MIKIYNQIVYKRVEDLIPYENNARNNEQAVEALVKFIPVSGFNVPIVIDKNNVIVKGHSRLEALKRLGMDLAPCIVIEGTEEEIAEERLVDNKLSELAEWDEDKLKYELREMTINLGEFSIQLPQFKSEVALVQEVTKGQLERESERLVGKDREVSSEKKSLVEIHCPHCGEDFFADMAEVMKYAT